MNVEDMPSGKPTGKVKDQIPTNSDALPAKDQTPSNDEATPENHEKGIPNPLYSEVWTVFDDEDNAVETQTDARWNTDDSKIIDVSDVRPLYDDDTFE